MNRLVFDSDMPKICVPIVGQTEAEIIKVAKELRKSIADLIEWRADFFQGISDVGLVKGLLRKLREALGDKRLLFTLRTASEGGEISPSFEEYAEILRHAVNTECVDYVDVEMFWGYRTQDAPSAFYDNCAIKLPEDIAKEPCHISVRNLVQELKGKADVIGSYHDFAKTPHGEEITKRLLVMKNMGASITKIAVMPQSKKDVLQLMTATLHAKEAMPDTPVISMSMGALGAVSRVAGANFGSAVTFGCCGETSAPGQIPVEELYDIMEKLRID
ncbi:MAG: type I 3-dehydroquinate dehydratase [Lachnospiraceae bacterium]|nr:type I 3-dehydroquinate dehydratase [Lachnospiraceae bacterium]